MKLIRELIAEGKIGSTRRKYDKGQLIFMEGDTIDKICLVEAGSVFGEKVLPKGDAHITDVFRQGDVFALEITASRTGISALDYVAGEDTVVRFVAMSTVEKTEFAEKIHREITHCLADENIRMSHKIEILAERGLRDRIMTYLRVLQRKSGTDTVTVPMSREQMAQFLCVNRSALSNELNVMKREGIIDFNGSRFKIY